MPVCLPWSHPSAAPKLLALWGLGRQMQGSGKGALDGALLSGKTPACSSFMLAPDSLTALERNPSASPTAVGTGLQERCALGAVCVIQVMSEVLGP